jgi:hypothetical protein
MCLNADEDNTVIQWRKANACDRKFVHWKQATNAFTCRQIPDANSPVLIFSKGNASHWIDTSILPPVHRHNGAPFDFD